MDKRKQIFFSGADLLLADFGVVMLHTYIVSVDFRNELSKVSHCAEGIEPYYKAYIDGCTEEERSIAKAISNYPQKMMSFAARVIQMYESESEFRKMIDDVSVWCGEMKCRLPDVRQTTIILAQFAKEWLIK